MALNASTSLPFTPQQVLETFTNREFVEHVSNRVGGSLKAFTVNGDLAGAFTTEIVREVPTARLPEIARKVVGQTITITQKENWAAPAADGSRASTVTIDVAGAPVSVNATQNILTADGGSRVDLAGEVKSSIPFMGGKIAAAAEPFVAKALNLQAREAKAWLER
ncbi:DUF2505 domain-containing protein [Neomicrococcus lactis]|uniref:DUF2505 domain-containing protein n=1 Tax=Neomicrococcus lactis TaxID=732241 RepID=A0A7W9DB70_9MICC|nr:DUF2505 domain-containing protein [Neomicrococcus lactis]MBB5598234.1 hypothetical protein [Neomicrococcus lactis]